MADQLATVPVPLNPAASDAAAQGLAAVVRQVGNRYGRGSALTEAAGCIMASAIVLTELCGAEGARDTMAWCAARAAEPLGIEAHAPFSLSDDGIPLPEPRTIGAASHHIVRNLREIARAQGTNPALEVTWGVLRAGIAVVREEVGPEMLATLLDLYARQAATVANMDEAELATIIAESLQ